MADPSSATPQAAVIGHPIAHSLSPALFAEFARAAGIDLAYEAVDVHPDALGATLARWRNDPRFVGCNVTMPHKHHILDFLDDCSDVARACSAVNAVRRDGARLIGDNTDVAGIRATLRALDFEPGGKRTVLFGAGGAAESVATVLGDAGASEVWIVGRSGERAQALASRAHARSPKTIFTVLHMNGEQPPPAELYINATPLGQVGQPTRTLLPANAAAGSLAFDLVYRPTRTPFLREASERGLRTIGGFAMLLEQALATFEAWFSFRPVLEAQAVARLEALAAPQEAAVTR